MRQLGFVRGERLVHDGDVGGVHHHHPPEAEATVEGGVRAQAVEVADVPPGSHHRVLDPRRARVEHRPRTEVMGLRAALRPLVADRARRVAARAAAEHHARRARARPQDVAGVAHRARGLEVERGLHRAGREARPLLEVGQQCVELPQILGGLHLGEPHRLERGPHDRLEVVEGEPGREPVDPHRAVLPLGRQRLERLPDQPPGAGLVGDRDGVLEVEDEEVRSRRDRLRNPVRLVAGDEERGSMEARRHHAAARAVPPPLRLSRSAPMLSLIPIPRGRRAPGRPSRPGSLSSLSGAAHGGPPGSVA